MTFHHSVQNSRVIGGEGAGEELNWLFRNAGWLTSIFIQLLWLTANKFLLTVLLVSVPTLHPTPSMLNE